jgi:hypothetical protein
MTESKFLAIAQQEPEVLRSLQRVAISANLTPTLDLGASGIILLSMVLPMTGYVVREIGLPWLSTLAEYSNLWRAKVDAWIEEQYSLSGIDRDRAKIAAAELRHELDITKDRDGWERVSKLLKDISNEE